LRHGLRAAVLRSTGGKALTAKHWPARLRFEGYAVALAALIANDLEPFAFPTTALSSAAKVLSAGIAAGLAAFGVAQTAFAIVVLFSFSKRESRSTFGTSDFKVWHRYLPRKISSPVLLLKLVRRV
jgi:hypothetical protein